MGDSSKRPYKTAYLASFMPLRHLVQHRATYGNIVLELEHF